MIQYNPTDSVHVHPFILTNLNIVNDSMQITASNTHQKSTDYETVKINKEELSQSDEFSDENLQFSLRENEK